MFNTTEFIAAEVAYRHERVRATYRPVSSDERYARSVQHQHRRTPQWRQALSRSTHRARAA